MTERVMLTDQREQFLNGEYDGEATAIRAQKHRLQNSTKTVLNELTQIARSDEIDNAEVFDPDLVADLLQAILGDHDKITPRWEFINDPDLDQQDFLNQHGHEFQLLQRLGTIHTQYSAPLTRIRKPDRSNDGGGLIEPDDS